MFGDADACLVTPDGGKSPVSVKLYQVLEIIKSIRRPMPEPKDLSKEQVVEAIEAIIKADLPRIDLPLVFRRMGKPSLSVRERNAGLVVSILQDYEKAGRIVRRGGDYNGITWETVTFWRSCRNTKATTG